MIQLTQSFGRSSRHCTYHKETGEGPNDKESHMVECLQYQGQLKSSLRITLKNTCDQAQYLLVWVNKLQDSRAQVAAS
jgi:hypothetical protein